MSSRQQYSESLIERSLGRFGGWQMTPGRPATRDVEVRGRAGAVLSRATGAPLGPVEADVLTWLLGHWVRDGCSPDGGVSLTLYELTQALYGARAKGREDRRAAARALTNLHRASVTVSDYDHATRQSRAGRWVDVHLVSRIHYGQELRALRDGEEVGAATIGALRGETLRVYIDSWLIERLQVDSVRAWLDWPVQRHLGGMAKRLWLYLEPHPGFRPLRDRPEYEGAVIDLSEDLYRELGANCQLRSDNRKPVRRGIERIRASDSRYVMLDFMPGANGTPDRLRVIRKTVDALGAQVRLCDGETPDTHASAPDLEAQQRLIA